MPPTLLVADDSLTIRRVIELTFADENLRVVAVADGREAIERIVAEPPDIVLADVGMPSHDGYEVAAFVKRTAHLAHIPVLLLAGAFEPVDEARARRVGCDGVLVKPFEPQLVIGRVRELLAARGVAVPSPGSISGDAAAAGRPGSRAPAAPSGASSDYLDRLDAAFAAMRSSGRPIGDGQESMEADADIPASAGRRPQAHPAAAQPERAVVPAAAAGRPSLSEAFGALLAAEQGKPLGSPPALPAPVLSDAAIDEIARRVIARLADEPMRQAVLDAAERLVQEEIDRIKGTLRQTRGA